MASLATDGAGPCSPQSCPQGQTLPARTAESQVDAQRCPWLPEAPQPHLPTLGCGAPWPGPAWPSPLGQGLGWAGAVALHPHRVTAWLHWPPPGRCPLCRPHPISPQVSSRKLGQGVRWDLHVPGEQSRTTLGATCRPPGGTLPPAPRRLQQEGPRCSGAGGRRRHLWLSCSICVSSWILS